MERAKSLLLESPYTVEAIAVGLQPEDLMPLAEEPDLVLRKLMVQAEAVIRSAEALAASGLPRVMLGGGDMADNRGPVYSVKCFREIVLPAYRRLLARCAELGIHYAFRSDGNLWPVADLLFGEAGCPGYGETDRDAGMKLGELRKRFPHLVVWDNVPSSLLQRGTARQVEEECRRILDESGGTGDFHGCSNPTIIGTPPKNIEAMFSVRSWSSRRSGSSIGTRTSARASPATAGPGGSTRGFSNDRSYR
jgi:uroporphyrinogen-III decarboxylase